MVPVPSWKDSWTSFWNSTSHLENPGKYDDLGGETKEILGVMEFSDGLRCDVNRQLSERFGVSHMLNMGQEDHKSGGTYSYTVSYSHPKGFAFAKYDGEGRVTGRFQRQLFTPRVKATLQSSVQSANQQASLSAELEYVGDSSHTIMKFEKPGIIEVSTMKSIWSRGAVGINMLHMPQGDQILNGMGVALKLWGRPLVRPNAGTFPRWVWTATMSNLSPFSSTFTYRTTGRGDFSTEFGVHPTPEGTVDTHWAIGAQYYFRTSRIRARVDKDLVVTAIIEELVAPTLRLSVMGLLDHWHQKYKFGMGISFSV